MRQSLQDETGRLIRSWMRHNDGMLRDYLVADVEDPRLNVQSLISRHFLLAAVCGARFQELMDQELRFAAAMNWLLSLCRELSTAEEWRAVAHGLERGADESEGIAIPGWIGALCRALPAQADGLVVPNYVIETAAGLARATRPADFLSGRLDLFMSLWRQALAPLPLPPAPLRVLEPACGSANDYRFLEASGLARLLAYQGFDLCEKNILNARSLFPAARFDVGNVFEIAAPDRAFDCLFAHDLFEHLSPEGLETAAAEVCRVTRQGLCLSFFNMDEVPDHLIRPLGEYHWNTLSMERMRACFLERGFEGRVAHVGTFLRFATGCDRTHNPNAYTFLLNSSAASSH